MAISAGSNITAADIATVATNINNTLTRYGIATETNDMTQNTKIYAAKLRAMIAKLQQADSSASHISANDRSTQLSTALTEINVGNLIKASSITTLNEAATHLYDHYCSCNCNYCACRCDRCSCDCNRCACRCDRCSCDCDRVHYCTIGSMHTCFIENTIIFTAQGPKPIQDVQNGDAILTINGKYDLVENIWNLEVNNQTVINYKGNNFNITLTKDHFIPITPNNEILYPQILEHKNSLFLRNGQEYPKLLLENLPYLISLLEKITSTQVIFKYDEQIIDLCNKIITDNFKYQIINNNIIIEGNIGEFNFVHYLQSCKNNNNEIIFPHWIYQLNDSYVKNYIDFINLNNYNFSYNQLLQLKLLFNINNYHYNIVNNKLVYLDSSDDSKNKIESIKEDLYSGKVYNLTCETQRFIASEIIVGDGYV